MIVDPPSTTVRRFLTLYTTAKLTLVLWFPKMQSSIPIPSENPPAYESAIAGTSIGTRDLHYVPTMGGFSLYPADNRAHDSHHHFCNNIVPSPSGKSSNLQDMQPKGPEQMLASSPQIMYGATASQATVFYYQDPRTGQRVASLLPPDHPQMVCLQAGEHVLESRYGFLGVLPFVHYSLSIVSGLMLV